MFFILYKPLYQDCVIPFVEKQMATVIPYYINFGNW